MSHRLSSRRIAILAFTLALVGVMPAAAQEAQVRIVTVPHDAVRVVVSPVEPLAAGFLDGAFLRGPVEPDRLPITLINLESGEEIATLEGPTDYVNSAVFAPDGRLATWHGNGLLYLWDVKAQTLLNTFQVDIPITERQLQFLPDGRHVAMSRASVVPVVEIWELETGRRVQLLTMPFDTYDEFREQILNRGSAQDPISVFDVSDDGDTIVAASGLSHIWQWDRATGAVTSIVASDEELSVFSIRQIDLLPDNQTIVYLDTILDKSLYALDTATGGNALTPAEWVSSFAVSPDGSTVAWVIGGISTLYIAPVNDLSAMTTLELGWDAPSLAELAFTPDGSRLVIGGIRRASSGDEQPAIAIVTLS